MSQQQPATGQQQSFRTGQGGAVFPTRNCLPEETREQSIETLNQVLADAVVLVNQCKSAHWNVKGLHFYQLHELFEDVAESLEGYVDDVAERVTALGGIAQGSVPIAAQRTALPQFPVGDTEEWSTLENVARSLAAFDATLQMGIEAADSRGDLDTADLLNELSREVSKSLWFVEAHLQGGQGGHGAAGTQTTQPITGTQQGAAAGGHQPGSQGEQQVGQAQQPVGPSQQSVGQSQQSADGAQQPMGQSGQSAGQPTEPIAGQY